MDSKVIDSSSGIVSISKTSDSINEKREWYNILMRVDNLSMK